MNQTTKQKGKALLLALTVLSAVIAAVLAVWQSILLANDFDYLTHTYSADSLSPKALTLLLVLASVFFLSTLLWRKKEEESDFPSGGFLSCFAAILCGMLLLTAAGLFFYRMVFSNLPFAGSPDRAVYGLRLLSAFLALPAAAYFFRIAFSRKPLSRNAVLLSFAPVAWTGAFLICVYYDKTVRINSPLRILEQMALIALMLAFLYESRFHMGKPKAQVYTALSLTALPLLATAAIPRLVMTFKGLYAFDSEAAGYCVMAAFLLHLLFRLLTFAIGKDRRENEADSVIEGAEAGEKTEEPEQEQAE